MFEPIDYWLFHDEFTVIQAALLIVGVNPSGTQELVLSNNPVNRPEGFNAVFSGITKAILGSKLKASIRYPISYIQDTNNLSWVQYPELDEIKGVFEDEDSRGDLVEVHFKKTPDWNLTTVEVDGLKAWLLSRNFKPSFFFSETTSDPDYLNKSYHRYSAQLAAAIKVWIAFEDDNLLGAKTPKTAMKDWLTTNYAELGLVHQGKISKEAIKECAKVANWKMGGSATTPTS